MSRISEDARQRARGIRDEALARHAEGDRASLARLRDEIAELKAMLREQQTQMANLSALMTQLLAFSVQSEAIAPFEASTPRPLTDHKRMLLERVRDLRRQNLSFSQICALFQAEGVPTLSGEGQWSKGTLWNLWKNHHQQLHATSDGEHFRVSNSYTR